MLSLHNAFVVASTSLGAAAILLHAVPGSAHAQIASAVAGPPLTLTEAVASAVRASPDIVAAREAAAAARGRERQAGARANPLVSYSREQTGSGSAANSQNILEIEQPLDIGGLRGGRSEAARLRREAAEARVRVTEAQVAYEVTVAFANTIAAERRAALASQVGESFVEAERVASRRLAAGDVSGFTARRIRLEANRYSILRAESLLASRTARLALSTLLPRDVDGSRALELNLPAIRAGFAAIPADSLESIALGRRADLVALALEGRAAAADASVARRERTPIPVVAAGIKRESAGDASSQGGFVAGLRLPFPLWDRRGGAIEASDAETRRAAAELMSANRRVQREVAETADALRTAERQLDVLTPQVGADASATLRAAQAAYAEGEISLLEWLDAARAYQEVESGFANLRSEYLSRAAALARALGTTLIQDAG